MACPASKYPLIHRSLPLLLDLDGVQGDPVPIKSLAVRKSEGLAAEAIATSEAGPGVVSANDVKELVTGY